MGHVLTALLVVSKLGSLDIAGLAGRPLLRVPFGLSPVVMLRLFRKLEMAPTAEVEAGRDAGGVDCANGVAASAGSVEFAPFGVTGGRVSKTSYIEGMAPGNELRFGLDKLIAGDAGVLKVGGCDGLALS